MKPRHQISRAAIDLIKRFEGYRAKSARLADGRWTIGYGHTLTAREGAEVSEQDAEALLLYDLIAVAHAVNESIYTPLNQNQFDALCCFAFNIGVENFRRSSVLRRINEGQMLQAACGMELWRKADFEGERIVIDALVRRRAAEKTLFLTPMEGWVPAPSPVLRPNIDADVAGIVPRQTPVALTTALEGEQAVAVRDPAQAGLTPAVPDEGEEASPAQAAAAAVSYRLQAMFREPPPEAAQAETAPAEDAPSITVASFAPRAEAAPQDDLSAPPPPMAMVAGGRPFSLTAPEPEADAESEFEQGSSAEATPDEPPAPTLFEVSTRPANDVMDPPPEPVVMSQADSGPKDDRPVLRIDDTLGEVELSDFEAPVESPPRRDLAQMLVLAVVGLALFGGGLVWAFSANSAEGGLLSPLVVGWFAGIVGVACFGLAAYLVLQRLGSTEDDDAVF